VDYFTFLLAIFDNISWLAFVWAAAASAAVNSLFIISFSGEIYENILMGIGSTD
jgi:hypothetical protein